MIAKHTAGLQKSVRAIASQVQRLNLVLDAGGIPSWASAIDNVKPIIASRNTKDAGKILPAAADDDFVFFLDDRTDYPTDYVARMLKAFDDIAIERKIIGVEGIIYSDFFDGQAASQLLFLNNEKLPEHQLVNQLDIATVLCRGSDARVLEAMRNSGLFSDLSFAAHCYENAIPLICVAHEANWLKWRSREPTKSVSPTAARETQKIAGFGRLPIQYLDRNGHIPLKSRRTASTPEAKLLNPQTAVTRSDPGKARMSVLSWSLGHNPVGRAHTLADLARADFNVELAGVLIPRRGSELWHPLRDTKIPVRGGIAEDMVSYLEGARALVESTDSEIVYVGKPRFASLFLGMLLSAKRNCPLLLDIDDLELSFLKNQSPLAFDDLVRQIALDPKQGNDPTSELWTRFADTLIGVADAVTVSNEALQARYGGTLVRHARDEAMFFPDEKKRQETRRELSLRDDQTGIMFVGTPRPHKGLERIASALAARGDDKIVLCVVGIENESAFRKQFGMTDPKTVRVFPPRSFTRLPEFIRAGDAVCLLQDTSSPISDFQIPAKLSEALAMGLPVLASRVAPFVNLIASGAVQPIDTDEELRNAIDNIVHAESDLARSARRALFLSEFSYAANRPRLRQAVEIARAHHAAYPRARDAVLRRIAGFLSTRFGVNVL
jgi:glycosyltransferase involved in cell wall biosynthesis